MRSWIPNAFTLSNLVFGILSIHYTFQKEYSLAAILIILSLVADAFDGRTARALGVSGDFGKELDSLCDGVSFGVAPAFLIYHFAQFEQFQLIGAFVAILYAICGIFRLARFNTMADVVKGYFLGMPIPTGGCLIATYVLSELHFSPWVVLLLVLLWGPLMVSTFKFPDFKGDSAYPNNKIAMILAICVGIYFLTLSWKAIGFSLFFSYMVFGMLNTFFSKVKPNK